jgi:HK97 family phage portal protein
MLGAKILERKKGPAPIPEPVIRTLAPQQTVSPRTTEEVVQGISAYRRGQRLIARTIGMLPFQLCRDGIVTVERLPLLDQPVPWMKRQPAIESMVSCLIDFGNYFAIPTQYDYLMRPQGLIPVHPRNVAVALGPSGMLFRINGTVFGSSDVVHIRTGGPVDSLLGWGVLQTSASTLETALNVTSAVKYFYKDGVYPAGILHSEDEDLTQDQADELRDQWVAKVRRGEPAVLPAGTTWTAVVSPNAEQAQLALASHMSRQEVADLLDLDGDWLGVPNSSMTYANLIDRVDTLIRLTCQPWMQAVADTFTDLTPRPYDVDLATNDLLKAQIAERYATYKVGIDGGWLLKDEVREAEGMEPLPEEPELEPLELEQEPTDDEPPSEGEPT